MSADNGIYIAQFPTKDGGIEYRVVCGQAVENLDLDFMRQHPDRLKLEDVYRAMWYADAKPHQTKEAAVDEAHRIYDEIMNSDFPVLEYGICELEPFDRPLNGMSSKEAYEYLMKSRGEQK